jgi:hypothetical protein
VSFTPSGANTSGNLQIVAAANAPLQSLTVTVTANDNDVVTPQAAGSGPLTASRQFIVGAYQFLIIDDVTGQILAFDAAGNYVFIDCRKSAVPLITGVGTVTTKFCISRVLDEGTKLCDWMKKKLAECLRTYLPIEPGQYEIQWSGRLG